jgi:hypothetical protein
MLGEGASLIELITGQDKCAILDIDYTRKNTDK